MYITWPSNIFGTPLQHFIFNFCYLFIQENKASELWLFAYFGFPLRWLAGQAAVVLVLDIQRVQRGCHSAVEQTDTSLSGMQLVTPVLLLVWKSTGN